MIDRFGKRISVGWPDHHILWIEAAMTLPRQERIEAFQDIAEMTCRDYAAVYKKACAILEARERAARREHIVARAHAYEHPTTRPAL